MNLGRTVFSQLVSFFPTYQFQICVDRYQGNRYVKEFSCWDQFLCLAFAQLTYRESLRDIEACLRAQQPKLYHMGFRGQVSRNTLAHANEHRDWRIYADFAQLLIATARDLYRDEPFGVELSETVYAFDSTTIDLCLTLFPWGKFRRHKSAVKLHTLLDLRGSIPTNVYVTGGQVNDVNILDQLFLEAGVLLARSRLFGLCSPVYLYPSLRLLHHSRQERSAVLPSLFAPCRTIGRTALRPNHFADRSPHAKRYPDPLRRIRYFDVEKDLRLTFLTNNFLLSALTITQLYRARWQVELFFRWIKQHLRIKAFYGTSENAVKTQVWVAVSVYVLVAIVKKQLGLELSLYKILQILSVTVFEKTPILEGFSNFSDEFSDAESCIQLNLFDF
jgi:Domain of unknown function (DUF4372)/Transposase DDE domain